MGREVCSPQMEPHGPVSCAEREDGNGETERKLVGSRERRMGEEAGRQVEAIPKVLIHGKIWAFGLKHRVSTLVHIGITWHLLKMLSSEPCPQRLIGLGYCLGIGILKDGQVILM